MQKRKRENQTTNEKDQSEKLGNFINNDLASKAMRKAAGIPLLFVDDSDESKKAQIDLDKAKRHYVVRRVVSEEEKEDLRPPILYSSDGIFKGYESINTYASSKLWFVKNH